VFEPLQRDRSSNQIMGMRSIFIKISIIFLSIFIKILNKQRLTIQTSKILSASPSGGALRQDVARLPVLYPFESFSSNMRL
jgi:hypothetical protein